MPEPQSQRYVTLAIIVLFESGLGALAILLSYVLGVEIPLFWSAADLGAGVLATLPMLLLYVLFTKSDAAPLREIRDILRRLVLPIFAPLSGGDLALVSLAAGFGEELLFRGFLQQFVERGIRGPAALIAVAVLFGLAHFLTPAYAIIAGCMGVYFSLIWAWTGNLLTPIATHALYDFVVLFHMLRDIRRARKELRAFAERGLGGDFTGGDDSAPAG